MLKRIFKALLRRRRYAYALPVVCAIVRKMVHRNVKHIKTCDIKERLSMLQDNLLPILEIDTMNSIQSEADKYIENSYSLFGCVDVRTTDNKWSKDFKTGYVWPRGKAYYRYKIINYATCSDVKFPWDMSRCHHFLILGQAYLQTGEEKFAYKIKEDILDFEENNPFLHSVNWTCAMDVAIRAANWICGLALIYKSDTYRNDTQFQKVLVNCLSEHIFFIEHNLEKYYPYSGNHYIADLTGLLFLYYLLGIEGNKFDYILNEYQREVLAQVRCSGFHFEMSTSDHKLVLEMVLKTFMLLKIKGVVVDADVEERIKSMVIFMSTIVKPDGKIPFIGDNDNGRFLPFTTTDYSDGLDIIKWSRFAFPDLVLDESAHSKYYPDERFAVLKNGNFFVTIQNNPISRYAGEKTNTLYGTHTHCDMLSFTLSDGRRNIIVDPGTYCYTSSPEIRFKYRGTQMHNTMCVDELDQQSQNRQDLFTLTQYSFPIESKLEDDNTYEGAYQYVNNTNCFYEHRRVLTLTEDMCFIKDVVKPIGTHHVVGYYHLSQDISPVIQEESVLLLMKDQIYKMVFKCGDNYKVLIKQGEISPSYGLSVKAPVIEIDFFEINKPLEFTTEIIRCD